MTENNEQPRVEFPHEPIHLGSTENKIIPIAETFDEKVNTWITILTVMLGASRKDEYLQAWKQFQELVNTRDDWSDEKKINFIRVCEQDALNWHHEFIKSRIRKGYFRDRKEA
jgi:flagellar biosynthesis regulator FlbT